MFLRRLSNQLKRTHKVLLTWTVVFVSIQALTQLLRIANDVLTIYARETAEASQLVEWSFFTAMNTVSGVTTFFTFINLMSLFVILFFVQQVFWQTARLVRAISQKVHSTISIVMRVVNGIFLFVGSCIVIMGAVFYACNRMGFISNTTTTVVFALCFVIIVMLLFYTSMVLASGIVVLKTIKQTSAIHKISSGQKPIERTDSRSSFDIRNFERKVQSPFKITFGLLVALLFCVLMEIIAGGLSSTMTNVDTMRLIWYILNCTGILVFAITILFLWFPLFWGNENAFNEIEKRKQAQSILTTQTSSQLLIDENLSVSPKSLSSNSPTICKDSNTMESVTTN
ncbi:hypothetical protein FDP41_007266 [Naegleria fowleri]|uniref:THH1/TOM1/TOM3 domain-containing protein n=1 Tax=Naegleria fowleri TaxID=5763 RepID=A0A6A5BLU2_NAEFO|nr:uncharacterized protein FDP41_007266 [Naegleria fowleri]KAF0973879.1 hypothetical protein FDP41_007266 [Naegleria fowleri]